MRTLIWTRAYRPFIMGGDVNAPVGFWKEGDLQEHALGRGFTAYLVESPDGQHAAVVDRTSGGIVGGSLEEVRKDVASCADIRVMERQIAEAVAMTRKVCTLSEEAFWEFYTKAKR